MTAEISILNKSAIVLAGDSAITIGDGKKVYNTANKIFQLTNKGNVGIMIYNQATWMGIPLETIIKTYRIRCGNKVFATLEEYKDTFIDYIKKAIKKYISAEAQNDIVILKTYDCLDSFFDLAIELFEDEVNTGKIKKPRNETMELAGISQKMQLLLSSYLETRKKEIRKLNEFKNYTFTSFKTKHTNSIRKAYAEFIEQNGLKLPTTFLINLTRLLYYEITYSISEFEDFTGIVIAGFGDDEIFPKIIDFKLGELFENKLRLEDGRVGEISNNRVAIVRPYAQRDMVDTFFQGIEPNLVTKLSKIVEVEFQKLAKKISTKYSIKGNFLDTLFQKTHVTIGKEFYEYRDKIHIDPIITTVSFLNKEGLIELAESLVHITSLKRKTSSDVETVGGPIDVALITKGDGFKWIKNKALNK